MKLDSAVVRISVHYSSPDAEPFWIYRERSWDTQVSDSTVALINQALLNPIPDGDQILDLTRRRSDILGWVEGHPVLFTCYDGYNALWIQVARTGYVYVIKKDVPEELIREEKWKNEKKRKNEN